MSERTAIREGKTTARRHRLFPCAIWLLACCLSCSRDSASESTRGRSALIDHNLLLITLDTTRADRIGAYGHGPAKTPTIDALAARGVMFQRAYAQVPLTLPSHASLLTGRYPREHGVRLNGRHALGPTLPTLATLFRDRGYQTGAFVSAFVLDSRFGLDRGFDVYQDDVHEDKVGGDILEMQRPADEVTGAALAWLGQRSKSPFFCWIHYYDPHHPYAPPSPYKEAHRDPYDGEIAFMDAQLKRVMDWLSSAKLADRTLVVVIGDHGESFGEHGEHGHVIFLYNTNLHIPLVFVHPKVAAGGRRVATPVSLVDVFPTVVEWFGLAGPGGLLSHSLLPAMTGTPPATQDSFAENNYVRTLHGWSEQRSLTTARWKYVASAKPELFDLQNDPGETRNLAASESDLARRMDEALRQRYSTMTPRGAVQAMLDEKSTKALESLGYLSATGPEAADDFLSPGLPDPKDHIEFIELVDQAYELFEKDDVAKAVTLLEQAVAQNPDSARVLNQLGRSHFRLRNFPRAIEVTHQALKLDPQNYALHRTMALSLTHAERHADSLEHYRIALGVRPDDPMVRHNYGVSLFRLQQTEEAVVQFRETLRLKPDYGDAMINLSTALSQLGQTEEAERWLALAAGERGADPVALINLGKMQLSRGETATGIETLEKALTGSPGDERVVTALAPVYFQNRRTSDLARILRSAVLNQPDNVRFLHSLAEILATSSNDEIRNGAEAVSLSRRAAALTANNDPDVLGILSAALAEAGEFPEAAGVIQRAIELARQRQNPGLLQRLSAFQESINAGQPIRHPRL